MKKLVLYASVAFSSGLFFTNIYNSIVNAATRIKSIFVGSINWKKVPGLATTKKSLVAVMD